MSEAKALLHLQELDLAYSHLKHDAENLSQKQELLEVRAQAKKVAGELKQILTERKDIEIKLDDLSIHKQYLLDKVAEINDTESTGFRETKDLEASLSSLSKKIEKVDFESEQLYKRHELVSRAEKKAQEVARDISEKEQDVTLSYKLALERIAKEVQQTRLERAEVAGSLSEESLAKYEAARKQFGGIAVETLNGTRPTACRVTIKEGIYNELIHQNNEVTLCPNCKRILVLPQI